MLNEEVLIKFQAFKGLDRQKLAVAAKNAVIGNAKKGTIIFKRGKILTDKFFLLEGQVDLINNEFGVEKVEHSSERSAEMLNLESPTKVSAIAKSTVRYFSIPSSVFEGLFKEDLPEENFSDSLNFEQPEQQGDQIDVEVAGLESGQDWMSCLLKSPLFSRIPLSQLQDLFNKFETVDVDAGEVLVKEGAKGDYFYVIAAGSAQVSNRLSSIDVQLQTGQYFGEESLVSCAPRNATVTMLTKGRIKRLCAADFGALIQEPVLRYVDSAELEVFKKPHKLLDVKMPIEYRVQHVPGAINIPLTRLRKSLSELAASCIYVVTGDAGSRADIAAYLLCQAGFEAVILKDCEQLQEVEHSA